MIFYVIFLIISLGTIRGYRIFEGVFENIDDRKHEVYLNVLESVWFDRYFEIRDIRF